jgi:hypothetical protein
VRRGGRSLTVVLLVLLALFAAWWLLAGRTPAGSLSAAALTPAPTPADTRQVAVLTLRILSDEAGRVAAVELVEGVVRPGYAPNVTNRPGAWTVSALSDAAEVLRFGTEDPRQIRIEGGAGEAPHTTAFEPDVEVNLVVPLSDVDGTEWSISQLQLYDELGNLIFAAAVRGGKIAPITIRQFPAGAPG